MSAIAVGQAADERELVRLFGQVRKQLANLNPIDVRGNGFGQGTR